jgi:hypothetical protein
MSHLLMLQVKYLQVKSLKYCHSVEFNIAEKNKNI